MVAAIESDAQHAAVYQYNFPLTATLNDDVATIRRDSLVAAVEDGLRRHDRSGEGKNREIDVVIGGPPCQGFSVIGKRDATESRNKLVYAFLRVVAMLRPKYFAMENVPGMAMSDHGATLRRVLAKIDRLGYDIAEGGAQRINAADFGVPQDRTRLFIVGSRKGVKVPTRPVASGTFVTVREAIGDLPDADEFGELLQTDEVVMNPERVTAQHAMASPYARTMLGVDRDMRDFSRPRKRELTRLTCSLRTLHSAVVRQRFAGTRQDGVEKISRFHRLPSAGRSNTIRAGTGLDHGSHTSARPIHPERPRVITAREAARLQSFPDWFRFHATCWHAFREIGNAVPPRLARAVAETIVEALGLLPRQVQVTMDLGDTSLLQLPPRAAKRRCASSEGNGVVTVPART